MAQKERSCCEPRGAQLCLLRLLTRPVPPLRFSHMIQDKALRTSWARKMKERQEKKLVQDLARQLQEGKWREREVTGLGSSAPRRQRRPAPPRLPSPWGSDRARGAASGSAVPALGWSCPLPSPGRAQGRERRLPTSLRTQPRVSARIPGFGAVAEPSLPRGERKPHWLWSPAR